MEILKNKVISREYVEQNYVHNDKIKEIIDTYGFSLFTGAVTIPVSVLTDLLGGNNEISKNR